MRYLIQANYGNDSLALIEWFHQRAITDVCVVSIDTGWSAANWSERVSAAESYVRRCGFEVIRLQARLGFAELAKQRGEWPSQKFQWCATYLKGMTLLDWLDTVDPTAATTLVLAKQKQASRANQQLSEYIETSEHYGGRRVWHPLLQLSQQQRDEYIRAAGFPVLPHRSLECDPCIHSSLADLQRMQLPDISKTEQLEAYLHQPCRTAVARDPEQQNFSQYQQALLQQQQLQSATQQEQFATGCGSPYACGE